VSVGDATSLAYEDGAFTHVLAIECAFHFNTRCDFFREARRVLTNKGTLALTDVIPRQGVSREEYLSRIHFPAGTDGRLDVPENVYGADTYRDHLRAAGFDDIHLEVITERTVPYFADHLEQLSRRSEGERAERLLNGARIYRGYIAAGMEYILVSARKSGA
jgi:ubiquinone/menaquinone biosynthesis C-methylase UbiE